MENTIYNRPFHILDGTTLKIIAMISMVLDHVGDNFFSDQIWMRIIGRIAMPIFAFCVAEGFIHTHDKLKYLYRMVFFALISEVPFDLVTSGKILEFTHQNIMMTFFWAILGLFLYENNAKNPTKMSQLLSGIIIFHFTISSLFMGLDYNMVAVGLIFIYYLLKDKAPFINNAVAVIYHALLRNVGIYWFGLLGFIPIFLYNGKRGIGLKWLFYIFYPAHLLLIWFLKQGI